MTDTLMQIIQWAIPSGGIGAAIAYLTGRKARAAATAKSVHDTYKLMYEDVSRELLATQQKIDENAKQTEALGEEYKRTRYALNRLTRAIQAIQRCPHSGSCPVSGELSLDTDTADLPTDRTGATPSDKPSKPKRGQHPQAERKHTADAPAPLPTARPGGHGSAQPSA